MTQKIQFKTTINCSGCLARVTPILNAIPELLRWQVDILNPDKILTVEVDESAEEKVVAAVLKAGFKMEKLNAA